MTSRERLLAAIGHREADRVPVSPRVGAFLREYYGHGGWLYELKAAQEFGYDPLVTLEVPYPNYVPGFTASGEDLEDVKIELRIERQGESTRFARHIQTPAGPLTDVIRRYPAGREFGAFPNPVWEERLVKDEADLERLAFLSPQPEAAAFAPLFEIQSAVGDRGLMQLHIDSAIDHRAGWAYEVVDMMVAAYEQPEFLHRLLGLFHGETMALTRCALEAGIEVIFTSWYFASLSAGWSPRLYHDLFLPLLREQVDLVHSYGRLYHYYDDGKCALILPWLADVGVDVLSTLPPPPMGDTPLKEAKAAVGDRICLNGNIDLVNVLMLSTPEAVRESVRQAILDAAPGGGFILGTSDSIRDAPLENVRAYFQAARDYGRYSHLG